MFVVIYHKKTVGSYLIGVADSIENAERIIQEDMRNTCEMDCRLYHIEAMSLNYARPVNIEMAVSINPYTK